MAKTVGTVTIAEQLCKGCDLCVVVCPEHVLAMTTQFNSKGWPIVALVADGCTGCTCAPTCAPTACSPSTAKSGGLQEQESLTTPQRVRTGDSPAATRR